MVIASEMKWISFCSCQMISWSNKVARKPTPATVTIDDLTFKDWCFHFLFTFWQKYVDETALVFLKKSCNQK